MLFENDVMKGVYMKQYVYLICLLLAFSCSPERLSNPLGEIFEDPSDTPEINLETYISGACQTGPDELDVSILLVNQEISSASNILPKTVSALMSDFNHSNFEFTKSDYMTGLESTGQLETSEGTAFIEGQDGSEEASGPKPITAETISLEYRWSSKVLDELQREEASIDAAYEERIPLLILLMDQSRSLLGLDRSLPEDPDFMRYATDARSERLTFFRELVGNLDERFAVSMMWFSETLSTYNTDLSSVFRPVESRDLVRDEIDRLQESRNYKAGTPLRQALTDAKSLIETLDNDLYDPVILVFTDGTESGDSSAASALPHEELSQFFVERHVPVHTIQLRAPINPDLDPAEEEMRPIPLWEMSALACQTGGEFYYLENAAQFTYNNTLEPIVRNRLTGRWSLKVSASPFSSAVNELGTPGVKMSSQVEVTLANDTEVYESRVFEQTDSDGQSLEVDKRAWVHLSEP